MKSGIRPLGYKGVTANNPPELVKFDRDPTVNDWKGFREGTFWLNKISKDVFICTKIDGTKFQTKKIGNVITDIGSGSAVWLKLFSSGGDVGDLTGLISDDGNTTTNDNLGKINISVGTNINTYRIGDNELGIKMPSNVVTGGTINPTILNAGVLNAGVVTVAALAGGGLVKTSVIGTLGLTPDGVDGEILIGSTAGDTTWGNIVSGDASIVVTNGSNSIEIKTPRGTDGQLKIHGGGGAPVWANITAGEGIVVLNTPNTCIIEKTAGNRSLPPCTMLETDTPPNAGGTWLPCNGAVISKEDYPDLWNCLGHKYYTGGLTMFNWSKYDDLCSNKQPGNKGLWMAARYDLRKGVYQVIKNDLLLKQLYNMTPTLGESVEEKIHAISHNGLPTGSGGMWVAVTVRTSTYARHRTTYYSLGDITDESSWVRSPISHNEPTLANVKDMYYGGGVYICGINYNSLERAKIFRSLNGITWSVELLVPWFANWNVYNAVYNNGVWLVLSIEYAAGIFPDATRISRSHDNGSSWDITLSSETTDLFDSIYYISASGDSFIMTVKNKTIDSPKIYTSKDGLLWEPHNNINNTVNYSSSSILEYDNQYIAAVYDINSANQLTCYSDDIDGIWSEHIYEYKNTGSNVASKMDHNLQKNDDSRFGFIANNYLFYGGASGIIGENNINLETHFQLPDKPGWMILS